jgi:hypothetical protein
MGSITVGASQSLVIMEISDAQAHPAVRVPTGPRNRQTDRPYIDQKLGDRITDQVARVCKASLWTLRRTWIPRP